MEEIEDFYQSMDRFSTIDGENFGPCLKQVISNHPDFHLYEYRFRKKDSKLCIIQFYTSNNGYAIFVQE